MTTPWPEGHPPLDDLERPDATVAAHLSACADCTELASALTRVSGELGALQPIAMPADVADRLGTAIAQAAGTAPAGASVTTLPAARSRRTPPTWVLGAAAAIVGAVLVGGAVLTRATDGAGSNARGTAPMSAEAAHSIQVSSGLTYTKSSLEETSRRLLAGQLGVAVAGAAMPKSAEDSSARATGSLGYAVDAEACYAALTGDPAVAPLAVDQGATFQGKPAWVVVVPASETRLFVYVVDPTCGPTDQKVKYVARIAR